MPVDEQILDSGDKDALQELLISPGYALVAVRTHESIAALRDELERDHDPIKTATIRGKVAGLRMALDMPQILIAEVKPEKRK